MKKVILGMSALLLISANANALTFTFSDQHFLGGASWGTMTIEQVDEKTLSVLYTASNALPAGAQATGFGFLPNLGDFSVSNPLDGFFDWDQNNLDWLKLQNTNAIPVPSNMDEFPLYTTGTAFKLFGFGATDGNVNNINPPGITTGTSDIFYLKFEVDTTLSQIDWVGVRLQGFTVPDNDGGDVDSLFLLGGPPSTAVPEPATMLLFGTGLVGLAGLARRKAK